MSRITLAISKASTAPPFPNKGNWIAFGFEQGTALANSSTNYNRKRAAYVLKRFFCDDLNPVGFEAPEEHVRGAHGSDTSCYSCHYKLDPMAGFFRNRGALFGDASDFARYRVRRSGERRPQTYQSAWRAPEGTGRTWNVGYIRSPRWKEQNSYGESIADLSRIIRNAPEAKRCLMKRLTEYAVGDNQTIDGAYLDDLTEAFREGRRHELVHCLPQRDGPHPDQPDISRRGTPTRSNATISYRVRGRKTGRPAASPTSCRRIARSVIPSREMASIRSI